MTDLVTSRFATPFELARVSQSQPADHRSTVPMDHDPLASVFQHGDLDLQIGCLPTPPTPTTR